MLVARFFFVIHNFLLPLHLVIYKRGYENCKNIHHIVLDVHGACTDG